MAFKSALRHGAIDWLLSSGNVKSSDNTLCSQGTDRAYLFGLVVQLAAAGCITSGAYANTFTARDREFYWYGIGAGIAITVCELELKGDVRKGYARRFIRDAIRSNEIRSEPKSVDGLIDASKSNNCRGV
ncbi:hypothetical protein KBY83_13320 [Cyanobium sp. WKJ7-Wakatipu]|uniref:hypothetical protein n=1 Tax=Cyanobium sp. WKJ7-Wakatipu TaxID=2823726 RepID=UPI0020CF220D|nr:hypothetical protein [Cyanobium sp. WKJ7-Wakatipu]MCP9784279.1 hypothetical protein [Cyanobium sp. WKJ7-Wakatipu]